VAFKRTFSIRRPVVKAATPTLSRRITALVKPESILDIDLREEINGSSWLSEADFRTLFNKDGILTLELWMEGSGAYPDSVTRWIVVDTRGGQRVVPSNAFSNLPGLAATVKKLQSDEVKKALVELKADKDFDADPADLFSYTDFTEKDLNEFSVDGSGVVFHYDYGFPHVIEALQPAGEFQLTWTELKPFIRRDGLLARFIR
jgi:hypothetical protein